MIVEFRKSAKADKFIDYMTAKYKADFRHIDGREYLLRTSDMEIELQGDIMDEVISMTNIANDTYTLASRDTKKSDTIIDIRGTLIGGDKVQIIAGPCSLDTKDNLDEVCKALVESGVTMLRGGAFKPRTCPYSFQGLGIEGLELLKYAREQYGLVTVSEIVSVNDIDAFMDSVDIIQVGARNMQNFDLLKALGKVNKPVLLKRGFASSLEELLMSAEYILAGGNSKVILCERGVRVAENGGRATLDLTAVPMLKRMTHLPIFVDPSHGTGDASLVGDMSRASVAVGADGIAIEVHPNPAKALSDGKQSITPSELKSLMVSLKSIAHAIGKEL